MTYRLAQLFAILGMLVTAVSSAVLAQSSAGKPGSTVSDYCRAWSTADRGERDQLLTKVWTLNGVYTDPEPTVARGRTALSKEIGRFLGKNPGSHFRCSAPQIYGRTMRIAWELYRKDGTLWTQGMDFGELAQDGRIRRIVGFFGPLPAIRPL